MRAQRLAGIVALMMPLGASALVAQETFEGVVTYQINQKKDNAATGGTLVYSVKGSKVRMDMQQGGSAPMGIGASIYDATTGTMTILMPPMKGYMTMNMSQDMDSAQHRADSALQALNYKKTGSETVAGVSCDDYQGTDATGKTSFACVAHGMGNFMMFGRGAAGNGPFANLFKDGFLPLKMGTIENGQQVVQMVATSVERKTLDASLFVVPADYKDMGGMAGMMKMKMGNQ